MLTTEILQINEEFIKQNQKVTILQPNEITAIAITRLRDVTSGAKDLLRATKTVAQQLFNSFIKSNDLMTISDIETPLCTTQAPVLQQDNIIIVPILRGGLPYAKGITALANSYVRGYLKMANDHKSAEAEFTNVTISAFHLPTNIAKETAHIVLVEGAIASGATIEKAVAAVSKRGFHKITVLAAFATLAVVKKLAQKLPDVEFFIAVLDPKLNASGYIVPGTGDLTDRIYGDKDGVMSDNFEKGLQKWMDEKDKDVSMYEEINNDLLLQFEKECAIPTPPCVIQ